MKTSSPARFTFDRRASGVLLHVTSLPGPHGSGDLGPSARRFVDFLERSGQTWWQTLPVGPPGEPPAYSPYSSCSSRAGSPLLISLELLARAGWLAPREIRPIAGFSDQRVHFERTGRFREDRLRLAWGRFAKSRGAERGQFLNFCRAHRHWLDDFALYQALRSRAAGAAWTEWPEPLRRRTVPAIRNACRELAPEIEFHQWIQFVFDRQWMDLREYARERGIGLIGDVPIFVSHGSADVWAHPGLFQLDRRGRPIEVSGYPPDAAAPRGQRWGHPQYRWTAHRASAFDWWARRFEGAFELFDAVRIDHFLGFTRVWSIPARSRTARGGRWVKTPGREILDAVRSRLGPRPLIGEDLGHVTPEDVALRQYAGMPGMRVVQIGLPNGDPVHEPHRMTSDSVYYTGTHDFDTAAGWFNGLKSRQKRAVLSYLGSDGRRVHWDLVRLVLNSVANTAIIPMQDLLGLDSRFRMNVPGTETGNWEWRVEARQLSSPVARTLREMTRLGGRLLPGI